MSVASDLQVPGDLTDLKDPNELDRLRLGRKREREEREGRAEK